MCETYTVHFGLVAELNFFCFQVIQTKRGYLLNAPLIYVTLSELTELWHMTCPVSARSHNLWTVWPLMMLICFFATFIFMWYNQLVCCMPRVHCISVTWSICICVVWSVCKLYVCMLYVQGVINLYVCCVVSLYVVCSRCDQSVCIMSVYTVCHYMVSLYVVYPLCDMSVYGQSVCCISMIWSVCMLYVRDVVNLYFLYLYVLVTWLTCMLYVWNMVSLYVLL